MCLYHALLVKQYDLRKVRSGSNELAVKLLRCGRGDFQQIGINYDTTFSPVARIMTFRVVAAITVRLGRILYQGDIDTAYLNAGLKIKQYVRNIPGFPCPSGKVYK
ncbi:Reverse transcriptase, RNA-dependent DNA polymerase domain containing hypothetical protein [Phytophthora palmivora]|uniref:Reverse transcriptase Ty1/copia-type domain-containing protein n=1 Tax=Phytophthora palmivora TaxID=4796 RepID=A0A2P4YDH1_9STRA|nr:Reverse transcriptase, RNA-dependent DNA polymerase domain containing hypothetical protein [Phytophthora palmivora]